MTTAHVVVSNFDKILQLTGFCTEKICPAEFVCGREQDHRPGDANTAEMSSNFILLHTAGVAVLMHVHICWHLWHKLDQLHCISTKVANVRTGQDLQAGCRLLPMAMQSQGLHCNIVHIM